MAKDDTPILTRAEADAAIAIFDDLNERSTIENTPKNRAFVDWREGHGTAALRDLAISDAKHAEAIWAALSEDEQQVLVWDFEFMPIINDMRDWTEGGALPDVADAVAGVRAWLAKNCPDQTLKGLPMPDAATPPPAAATAAQIAPKCASERAPADLAAHRIQEALAAGRAVTVRSDLLPGLEHLAIFDSYASRDATIGVLRQMGFFAHVAPQPEEPGDDAL